MSYHHLITWGLVGSNPPSNHGRVWIDDNGYVDGETPVEDFGMFYYRDEPFPESRDKLVAIFLKLMDDAATGLDDKPLDQHPDMTVRDMLKTPEGSKRLWEMGYYGHGFNDEASKLISEAIPTWSKETVSL